MCRINNITSDNWCCTFNLPQQKEMQEEYQRPTNSKHSKLSKRAIHNSFITQCKYVHARKNNLTVFVFSLTDKVCY